MLLDILRLKKDVLWNIVCIAMVGDTFKMIYLPKRKHTQCKQNRTQDRTLGNPTKLSFSWWGTLNEKLQSKRQEGNHCKADPEMPTHCLSLSPKSEWSKVSKAAQRVSSTNIEPSPASPCIKRSFETLRRAVSIECNRLQLDWNLSRMLCSSASFFTTIFSTIQQVT